MNALALAAALVVAPPSDAWVTISREDLQARFELLWAVSDIHGHRDELERLLRSAGLVRGDGRGALHWDPAARRQLLIVDGDLVGGGPDSAGVVRLLQHLKNEAPAADSRVLVLLGNEEARRLLRPNGAKRLVREAPVAAFVGPWLFAHAGYIDAEPSEEGLKEWLDGIAQRWGRGGPDRYAQFLSGHSIVDCHEWWRSRRNRKKMRAHLRMLGLDALVFGHDPWALGAPGTIALGAGGSLLKLDTGMKQHQSRGMLLRCNVAEALRQGLSACGAALADGGLAALATGAPDR